MMCLQADYTSRSKVKRDWLCCNVSDVEGADGSQIELTVCIGQSVTERDFVDEITASLAGNVRQCRHDNFVEGDCNFGEITVNLLDPTAEVRLIIMIRVTSGNYLFVYVTPGNYPIVQENDTDNVDVGDS